MPSRSRNARPFCLVFDLELLKMGRTIELDGNVAVDAEKVDDMPVSGLPGRTDSKVARHLFDRRVRPSSKEGIADSRFASRTKH
jgi:hypothetical protein